MSEDAHSVEASRDRWKRRAKLFRQGYLDKATEAFALNLQRLQLEAYGADKTLAMQNESLRAGMLKACHQRNDYKAQRDALLEVLQLLQGYDWRLRDDAHSEEIKRRALAAINKALGNE